MQLTSLRIGEFGKVLVHFASSQMVSNFLRIISGLIVVRMLDPEEYGTFTGISIYLGYVLLGHLGVVNGVGRELPYQKGKRNEAYAQQLAQSGFVISALVGIASAVVFLVFAIYHQLNGDSLLALTFAAHVVLSGLHLLTKQFLPVLYRTNTDFLKLSRQNITVGFVNVVSVVLVYYFHYSGLLIRAILLIVVEFLLLYKNSPYKLSLNIRKDDVVSLFKIGLPIYAVGQVTPLWQTIVSNMMFAMGGAMQFGLYALSNIVLTTAAMIPTSFSQVLYPRMSVMLGQGKSLREIQRTNLRPMIFQFTVMLVVAVVGCILLPHIVYYLLPKYQEGVLAAQWILFVPVVRSISLNNIFNVTGKQRPYLIALVTGALVGTTYILLSLHVKGFRLEIFPQGLIIGTFCQQVLCIFFIQRLVRKADAN